MAVSLFAQCWYTSSPRYIMHIIVFVAIKIVDYKSGTFVVTVYYIENKPDPYKLKITKL